MKPGWLMKGGAAYLGDFTNKLGLLGLHDLNTETQTKLFANTLMLMCTNGAASLICMMQLAAK